MPKTEEFKILDLKGILTKSGRERCVWALRVQRKLEYDKTHKAAAPQHQQLSKKLGVNQGDNIFVFAGGYGDWANALSKTNPVIYSDLSKAIASYAFQRHPSLKEIACIADGALLPLPEDTDWLFSFEPIPLERIHLPLILLQGMAACNKGAIIVYRYNRAEIAGFTKMSEMAGLYKARYKTCKIRITNESTGDTPYSFESEVYVYRLEITTDAKAFSTLDLALISLFQKKTAGVMSARHTLFFDGVRTGVITNEMIAKLAEALKTGSHEILESLHRITKVSELVEDEDCIKTCIFTEK